MADMNGQFLAAETCAGLVAGPFVGPQA